MASLIEAEAKLPVDMPKVARVIYNRLDKGMRLQFDSTVHFAVGGAQRITTTDAERNTDSPYNTYKISGLPAGPICSPGEAAIAAALNPAVGDWIYFVSVNPDTGETRYGVTAQEHAAQRRGLPAVAARAPRPVTGRPGRAVLGSPSRTRCPRCCTPPRTGCSAWTGPTAPTRSRRTGSRTSCAGSVPTGRACR